MSDFVLSSIEHGSTAYQAMVALRYAVLRKPLGLVISDEELAREAREHLLACYHGGRLVGCLALVPKTGTLVGMKQVAVDTTMQRKGVGRALVRFAEDFARDRGFATMTLHARENAIPFYEKLGYQRVGEPFEQVTLLHWVMEKKLEQSA